MDRGRELLRRVVPAGARAARIRRIDADAWARRLYAPPSPPHVKRHVLRRNGTPGATWVETGTFLGDTTAFLADDARRVYSIEPHQALYEQAVARFRDRPTIEIRHGLSEVVLPAVLEEIPGDVNLWLDGHYSEGITFQGPKETPIVEELQHIATALDDRRRVVVLVDDVRCFDPDDPRYRAYPPLDHLVDWARDHDLHWHIEHDIFVARQRDLS
jgi:hypothetical protein